MENSVIQQAFLKLATAQIADACVRLGIGVRAAPPDIFAVDPRNAIAGRALPCKHYGSVDLFIEVISQAKPGDVLVIDDAGRRDQACVGDLVAVEAKARRLAGIVVWGAHRDHWEILEMEFPLFSYGRFPAGAAKLDARAEDALERAQFGAHSITRDDVVFADMDGVVFVPHARVAEVITQAEEIRRTERTEVNAVRSGSTLYQQLQFEAYMEKRRANPAYTFREHLREIGAAMEE